MRINVSLQVASARPGYLASLLLLVLGGGVSPSTRAASSDEEWPSYGRDFTNQRFSPLTQITTRSVSQLRVAWIHETKPAPVQPVAGIFKQESSPIIVGGVVYYTYPGPQVFALDATTGKELWRWAATGNDTIRVCCGPNNRGVAVDNGLVFVATLDARVIALNAKDGRVVWQARAAEGSRGYSFTMAPLVADGKVIVGAAGGEFEIRGFVDAYDEKTGQRAWRFWTVPSPDEGGWWGSWAETTPDGDRLPRNIRREHADSARYPDAWQKGGAPVWTTPSYDPQLGLIYFGTGNPGADYDDHERPGDNLYSDAIVAVDIKTGTHRWHYQMVPHDLWDYDAASPTVLFDVELNGSTIPAVAQAGKTGWVYIVDRRTGNRIVRSEPFVPHENTFAEPTEAGTRIAPGIAGGANWQPMAYSPRTRLLYVRGQNTPSVYHRMVREHPLGERYDGGVASPATAESFATTTAIDATTGKIRWQLKTEEPSLASPLCGGSLVTAGDLLFYGDTRGFLNAVDATTGQGIVHLTTPGAAWVRATPVTFSARGKQYIVLATPSSLVAFSLP